MANADKRSVSTDALETLGTIIDDAQKRDAIHLAVDPAIAGEKLSPGQDVGLRDGLAMASAEHLGIVDPFLTAPVQPGQRFWLVVYPRKITSLRHVWSHPSFADGAEVEALKNEADPVAVAKAWIERYAASVPIRYDELMEAARDHVETGDYLVHGGRFEGDSVPDEFWDHYEIVTGKKVEDNRDNFFSCSC